MSSYDLQVEYFERYSFLTGSLNKKDRWEALIFKSFIPKLNKNAKVLEIGSGKGRHVDLLLDISGDVSVNDFIPKNVEEINKKYGQKIKYYTCPYLDLPDKLNGNFDLVVLINVYHHIEEKEILIKKINDLLKNGGYVLMVEPNPLNLLYYLFFIYKKIWIYEKGIVYSRKKYILSKFFDKNFTLEKFSPYNIIPQSLLPNNEYFWKLNYSASRLSMFSFFSLFNIYLFRKHE